jgi:hypothetical protein
VFATLAVLPGVTLLRGTASAGLVVALLLLFAALLVAYFTVRSSAGDPRMLADPAPLVPPEGPQRYRVTIHTLAGDTTNYTVVTGGGTKKAASIAFDSHGRSQPAPASAPLDPTAQDAPDTTPDTTPEEVRDVRVERLGAVDREADGGVSFQDGDLFDRSEF